MTLSGRTARSRIIGLPHTAANPRQAQPPGFAAGESYGA